MTPKVRLSVTALGKLVAAGGAAWATRHIPNLSIEAAFAPGASTYLVNRANLAEESFGEELRRSPTCQLQLVLAGAFRIALDSIRNRNADYDSYFEKWDALLDAALDRATTLLPIVVPMDFDALLD